MSDLFREEVIERQTNRLHGDILVLPQLSHTLILGLLLGWLLAVVVWLISGTYARKETVLGWLDPSEGVTRIYAEDGGLIQQVLVAEGDKVQAGQPLIVVNGDRYLVDGEHLEGRLLQEYEAQQRLLTEQLENTARLQQRRREDLVQKIAAAEQDLALLGEQLATLNSRYRLAQELVERNAALHRQNFISKSDLDSIRTQELALRNERQGLLREQTGRSNTLDQLISELAALPDENANERGQLQTRLSDVAQKIAQLNGQRSYVIKASRPGQINNLQARAGERVHAGSTIPLLTVIPETAQLAAHLLVPVRSAGFVEPGQQLDIRYDAFPYQKFGLYRGEVVSISDTVLMPNELLNTPLRIEEPVYRISATLQQPSVQAYGRDFQLKPGMTLSADVRLGERTLLQWLLEPLYSLRGRL